MPDGNNTDNNERGRILHFKQDHSFYAKLGDEKRKQNDPVRAISRYCDALELEPNDHDTRLAAAEVLTDMSRFNDSNRLLIPYMQGDEYFRREAYCIIGFNLLGLNEPEGARNCFNRFFDLTDEVSERTDAILDALDYIDSLYSEKPLLQDAGEAEREERIADANDAFDRGDFSLSASILRGLAVKDPSDTGILYDLALSCLCSGEAAESEVYIDRLLAADENNWAAWSMKLMFAKGRKNEIEVKKICRRLEKCDSELPDVLFRVNGSLLEAGCPELALRFAKKLAKLLPYDALANHRLALSWAKLKQYDKAADVYGKLLRIDRNDYIARYYRTAALASAKKGSDDSPTDFNMLQYQLPFDKVILKIKELLDSSGFDPAGITARWESDEELRRIVRWAFSLHEYNINAAMLNLLRNVGSESAELVIREAIADIDAGKSLVNDALASLKRRGAEEPYFAMLDGNLIEGRVNLIDLSNVRIPPQYKAIFPRFRSVSDGYCSAEVVNAAAGITERFLANLNGAFPKITEQQSQALSAALEVIACEQCGAPFPEGIGERYGVTQRRLMNAVERMVNTMIAGIEKRIGGEELEDGEDGGDGE